MKMTPKIFLLVTVSGLLTAIATYGVWVNSRVMLSQGLPHVYSQYLLESSSTIRGKVIVDSGSNSQHAIVPDILAEYFNGPVINLALDAGYPLLPRIYNISRHVNEGDIVILPLEWRMYLVDEVLPSNFLVDVSRPETRVAHYYENMPALEKARFLFWQFPLRNVFLSIRDPIEPAARGRDNLARLERHRALITSGNRTAFGSLGNYRDWEPGSRRGYVGEVSCDTYLWKLGFSISDEFQRSLSRIKQLTDRGASVYFTWPVVVDHEDSPCYRNAKHVPRIEELARQIRNLVEAEGHTFIGEYRDSHFPPECFLDTYYHITETCAEQRSRRLVEQLAIAGALPTNSAVSSQQLLKIAESRLEAIRGETITRLESLLPGVREATPDKFSTHLLLSSGWSGPERQGVWSVGKQSTLSVKIHEDMLQFDELKLTLRGSYFNGPEQTGVIINQHDFGTHILESTTFVLPPDLVDGDILRLELKHRNVISPFELGHNNDRRKLKYRLGEIRIETTGSDTHQKNML